ncbi:MAG: hypothetical protein V3T30_04325, partial [Thermodesulfobacteriota bacterium]
PMIFRSKDRRVFSVLAAPDMKRALLLGRLSGGSKTVELFDEGRGYVKTLTSDDEGRFHLTLSSKELSVKGEGLKLFKLAPQKRGEAGTAINATISPYRAVESVDLSFIVGDPLLDGPLTGFYGLENTGDLFYRWTNGNGHVDFFLLPDRLKEAAEVVVSCFNRGLLGSGEIYFNGHGPFSIDCSPRGITTRKIPIPLKWISKDGIQSIRIVSKPFVLAGRGGSDKRRLGLRINEIRFRTAGND